MLRTIFRLLPIALVVLATSDRASAAEEPTAVACQFEHMPLMLFILRGGMGADDNTVQIGQSEPLKLSVGSSLMSATQGNQDLTFSLRLPANVSVSAPGNDTMSYFGECISSFQPD